MALDGRRNDELLSATQLGEGWKVGIVEATMSTILICLKNNILVGVYGKGCTRNGWIFYFV